MTNNTVYFSSSVAFNLSLHSWPRIVKRAQCQLIKSNWTLSTATLPTRNLQSLRAAPSQRKMPSSLTTSFLSMPVAIFPRRCFLWLCDTTILPPLLSPVRLKSVKRVSSGDNALIVTIGIPMKEEQNASTSANYDVELFHKANQTCGDLNSTTTQTAKEGCEYKTITLKWCTPRGSSTADLHHCIATSRITPTDVNSRPSSCLTNFLLSGEFDHTFMVCS